MVYKYLRNEPQYRPSRISPLGGFTKPLYLSHYWEQADQTWHAIGPAQMRPDHEVKQGRSLQAASPEVKNLKKLPFEKWLWRGRLEAVTSVLITIQTSKEVYLYIRVASFAKMLCDQAATAHVTVYGYPKPPHKVWRSAHARSPSAWPLKFWPQQ